jgi:SAM-dependent methyltransferase
MTGTTDSEALAAANAEAIEAWDGPLYDRWIRFRHIVTDGLGAHGEQALSLYPPQPGDRVLDVGCGLGDTTRRIAGLVGTEGAAVGVDAAARMIETAEREAREDGVGNVRFAVADVQSADLGGPYDLAFSRMGTMFFANPVAALRNVRSSLRPGGRLVMVVWRRREDNDWIYRGQQIVEGIVSRPEDYDEPTCGPGPFSMAGAPTRRVTSCSTPASPTSRCIAATSRSRAGTTSRRRSTSRWPSALPARFSASRATEPHTCTTRSAKRCARAWPSSRVPTASGPRRRPGS